MFADFAHRRFRHRNPRPNCQRSFVLAPVHGETHPSTISTFQRLNQRGRLDPNQEEHPAPRLGLDRLYAGHKRIRITSSVKQDSVLLREFCSTRACSERVQRVERGRRENLRLLAASNATLLAKNLVNRETLGHTRRLSAAKRRRKKLCFT